MLNENQDEKGSSDSINKSKMIEYFQIEDGDASKISWSHAVNSKQKLNEALKSNDMFIEADILFIEEKHDQPIMAHPPDTDSDLNFSEWLRTIIQTKKGLKLDFKSSNSVEPCLNILKSLKHQIQSPVILNADVFQGGKSPSVKIDPISFITNSLKYFPDGILSLGWTTTNNALCRYSWYDVYSAFKIVNTLVNLPNREITFAVRALWSTKSIYRLHWLTVHTQASLTVWSHEHDKLSSLESLVIFRKFFPNDKVFYDLPGKQNEYLRSNLDNFKQLDNVFFSNSNDKYVKELLFSKNFNKELWITKGDVLTSQYGALLISQDSSLISTRHFKSEDNFEFSVKFEIFSINSEKNESFNVKNQNYDQVHTKTPYNQEEFKQLTKISLTNLSNYEDFSNNLSPNNERSIDIFLFSNGLIKVYVSNKQEHEVFVEISDNYEILITNLGVKNLLQIDLKSNHNDLNNNSVQLLVKSNSIQTEKLYVSFTLMSDSHCIGIDALKISE